MTLKRGVFVLVCMGVTAAIVAFGSIALAAGSRAAEHARNGHVRLRPT